LDFTDSLSMNGIFTAKPLPKTSSSGLDFADSFTTKAIPKTPMATPKKEPSKNKTRSMANLIPITSLPIVQEDIVFADPPMKMLPLEERQKRSQKLKQERLDYQVYVLGPKTPKHDVDREATSKST
jgi:hypothetical protein